MLSNMQYKVAKLIASGFSHRECMATDGLPSRRDTFHTYIEALRSKNIIGAGKPGQRGSIPVRTDLGKIAVPYLDCDYREPSKDWMTSTVCCMIDAIYNQPARSRDFSSAPILADALQEADCDEKWLAALRIHTNCWEIRSVFVSDKSLPVRPGSKVTHMVNHPVLLVARLIERLWSIKQV